MVKVKRCLHEGCKRFFIAENPKQDYCHGKCRNKAGHLARKENNKWENEMFKHRKNTIKILEQLDRNKKSFISNEEIENLGLNLSCAYIPEFAPRGQQILRFGKFLLTTNKTIGFDISKVC